MRSSYVQQDYYDETDSWYPAENDDFMMAFAVTDANDGTVKNDPKFVKWFAHQVIEVDGTREYQEIPMKQCSEADFQEKFYQPAKSSEPLVERLLEA